jgi:hypothetical protein
MLEQRDGGLGLATINVRVAEKAGGVHAAHTICGQLATALGLVHGDRPFTAHRGDPADGEGRVALQARVADRLADRRRVRGGPLSFRPLSEQHVVEAQINVRHPEPPLLRRALEASHRRPAMLDAVACGTGPVALESEEAMRLAHGRIVATPTALIDGAPRALDCGLRPAEAAVHVREPEVVRPRQDMVVEPVQTLAVLEQALDALGEPTEEVKREPSALGDVDQHAVPLRALGNPLDVSQRFGEMRTTT